MEPGRSKLGGNVVPAVIEKPYYESRLPSLAVCSFAPLSSSRPFAPFVDQSSTADAIHTTPQMTPPQIPHPTSKPATPPPTYSSSPAFCPRISK